METAGGKLNIAKTPGILVCMCRVNQIWHANDFTDNDLSNEKQ